MITADVTGSLAQTKPSERRSTPPLLGLIWALLVVNTLGSGSDDTIIPIPTRLAQLITMGSLVLAFALALVLNPRLRIRPNAFLLLLSLLVVTSTVSSVYLDSGAGSLARCARLAVLVATLWLLTPWWDNALGLVRHHIRALGAVLVLVVAGLVIAPGLAMPESYGGRLTGVIWYLPPPQVAQFAAVAAGLSLLLWLGRQADGRDALLVGVPAISLLLLTHTRTATVGLIAGLAVAGLTFTLASSRARRVCAGVTIVGGIAMLAFQTVVLSWFQRGQGEDALQDLTGRQKVWDALLAESRTTRQQLFGVGLTDKSFGGLPIDSGWLAVFHEQGFIGVAIVVAFLGCLVVAAAKSPPSPARACAVFLIVYCLVASYTEVGVGDASLYLLGLALAAACVCRHGRDRPGDHSFGIA